MKKKQLTPYLAAGAAAVTAGQADAATVVTFYGDGARSPSTTPATPAGIDFGFYARGTDDYALIDDTFSKDSYFASATGVGYFTRGTDLGPGPLRGFAFGIYADNGLLIEGAIAGDENYANISFDGNDDVFEAVGQFFIDGTANGGGYLIAIAENDDGSALSISAGKAAIDGIPEPSTVGLLALGAAGLAMMRRRKR